MTDETRAPMRWERRRRIKIVAIWFFWLFVGAGLALLARHLLTHVDPAKPITEVEALRDGLGPYKFLLAIPGINALAVAYPSLAIFVTGIVFPGIPLAGYLAGRTHDRLFASFDSDSLRPFALEPLDRKGAVSFVSLPWHLGKEGPRHEAWQALRSWLVGAGRPGVRHDYSIAMLSGRAGSGKSRMAHELSRAAVAGTLADAAAADSARALGAYLRRVLPFLKPSPSDPWDVGIAREQLGDENFTQFLSQLANWKPRRRTLVVLDDPLAGQTGQVHLALSKGAAGHKHAVRLLVVSQTVPLDSPFTFDTFEGAWRFDEHALADPQPIVLPVHSWFSDQETREIAFGSGILDRQQEKVRGEVRERIYAVTRGNPLLLELALEWVLEHQSFAGIDPAQLRRDRARRIVLALKGAGVDDASQLGQLVVATLAGGAEKDALANAIAKAGLFPGMRALPSAAALRAAFPGEPLVTAGGATVVPPVRPELIAQAFVDYFLVGEGMVANSVQFLRAALDIGPATVVRYFTLAPPGSPLRDGISQLTQADLGDIDQVALLAELYIGWIRTARVIPGADFLVDRRQAEALRNGWDTGRHVALFARLLDQLGRREDAEAPLTDLSALFALLGSIAQQAGTQTTLDQLGRLLAALAGFDIDLRDEALRGLVVALMARLPAIGHADEPALTALIAASLEVRIRAYRHVAEVLASRTDPATIAAGSRLDTLRLALLATEPANLALLVERLASGDAIEPDFALFAARVASASLRSASGASLLPAAEALAAWAIAGTGQVSTNFAQEPVLRILADIAQFYSNLTLRPGSPDVRLLVERLARLADAAAPIAGDERRFDPLVLAIDTACVEACAFLTMPFSSIATVREKLISNEPVGLSVGAKREPTPEPEMWDLMFRHLELHMARRRRYRDEATKKAYIGLLKRGMTTKFYDRNDALRSEVSRTQAEMFRTFIECYRDSEILRDLRWFAEEYLSMYNAAMELGWGMRLDPALVTRARGILLSFAEAYEHDEAIQESVTYACSNDVVFWTNAGNPGQVKAAIELARSIQLRFPEHQMINFNWAQVQAAAAWYHGRTADSAAAARAEACAADVEQILHRFPSPGMRIAYFAAARHATVAWSSLPAGRGADQAGRIARRASRYALESGAGGSESEEVVEALCFEAGAWAERPTSPEVIRQASEAAAEAVRHLHREGTGKLFEDNIANFATMGFYVLQSIYQRARAEYGLSGLQRLEAMIHALGEIGEILARFGTLGEADKASLYSIDVRMRQLLLDVAAQDAVTRDQLLARLSQARIPPARAYPIMIDDEAAEALDQLREAERSYFER